MTPLAPRPPTPRCGDLSQTPFAELLLGLARDRFDGAIDFERDDVRKRILWQRGLPVMAESNLSAESLAKALRDRSLIDRDQFQKVVAATRDPRGPGEGAAVLAMNCVDAKELVATLRSLVRTRILECFEWTRGRFDDVEETAIPEYASALRCDPVPLALEGIAVHWSPARVREALATVSQRFPHPTAATSHLVERLGADPDTRSRCEALDGTAPLGQALAEASPVAWAAALVLERLGAWALRDEPWIAEPEGDDGAQPLRLPEYEIVVATRSGGKDATADDSQAAESSSKRRARKDRGDADAFRAEIQELHARLEELDHYAVLGVEEKSGAAVIKRAYFKLAKRFHPDALGRLGLEDVKDQAKEVFARIASAYEVLKDPAQRRDYDASRERGNEEFDAARLIQAESLFRKGEIMLGAGNFNGALEFLRPAVELWPEETEYQSALGWALFRKTPPDLAGARTHLEVAVQCGPKNAEAYQRLGLVLRALEDFKGADAALARAKVLDPKL